MFSNKINYQIINFTAFMVLLYIGLSNIGLWWGILSKCLSVLSPFIIGFAFAYAFTPLVRWLEKKGLPRGMAVTATILGVILLLIGLMWITLPMLYDQLSLFIKMMMEVLNNISNKFDINIGTFKIKITDYLNSALKEIGMITSTTTIGILNKSLSFFSKFIVGFVGFIYFLADMNKIRSGLKELLAAGHKKFLGYVKCMDVEITQYLKGLEIFMVIQFFEYSLLFFIIGHPNWLVLGVLACVTTVIPYFGGLITNLIAILMASVVSPGLVIATIVICLIFPQLDGYVISPRVYGKTNNVNPLITIMVVSIGGTLMGIPGIIAALPIYLLLRTTYSYYKKDLKKGMNKVKETI